MTNWPLQPIGAVADIFDGPHATPKTIDNGPIFLGISALEKGRINLAETRHVSAEDYETWTRRVRPEPGDVVFSYETRLGEAAIIPSGLTCCLGRRMALVRTRRSVMDPHFFLYYFLSPVFQEVIRERTVTGATVDRILLTEFPNYPVATPPLNVQRDIASLLSNLDDKIDLNRRMNETLEAMARAIFRDWFVDFGPTRAKMEGRAPYLAAKLWSLFPNRLDDEGKPTGWNAGAVSEIGQVICGKTPRTSRQEYYGDAVPFITIPDMHGKIFVEHSARKLSSEGASSQPKQMLPAGSICVSCIASPGLVVMTTQTSQTNQQINSVVPAEQNETLYWYWSLRGLGEQIKQGGSGGSVLANLSTGRFKALNTLFASRAARVAYHHSTSPLFARILENQRQSRTLAEIRDCLLPKLMSGEIHIQEAEKLASNVA